MKSGRLNVYQSLPLAMSFFRDTGKLRSRLSWLLSRRILLPTSSFHFHIRFRGGMPLIYSSERIASAISSYALPRLYEARKGPGVVIAPRPSICIPGCVRARTFKFLEYSPLFSPRPTCLGFRYFHRWKSNFSQFFCNSALKLYA